MRHPVHRGVEVEQQNDTVVFIKLCKITNKHYSVTISMEEFDRIYVLGELTQNVLPHRSAEEREFLISGITPAEWDDIFKYEEK